METIFVAAAPKQITRDIEERFNAELSYARIVLLGRYPFWGSLLQHLRVVVTYSVPTAAVSSDDRLFINPDFFHEIGIKHANPNSRRAFVLAHECGHPALGIFFRGKHHKHRISNVAHDHVINLMLKADDAAWIWEQCHCDPRFDGMAYEQVYHALLNEDRNGVGVSDDIGGGFGGDLKPSDFLPGEQGDGEPSESEGNGNDSVRQSVGGLTDAEQESRARRWDQRIIEAYLNAKAQGRVSAGAERMFGQVGKSAVRWETKFHNKLTDIFNRMKLDWGVPHRRYCATGIYAPKEQGLGLNCAVYMDTSGSISEKNILAGMAEIERITKYAGGRIRLLEGDAVITSDKWVRKLPERVTGGGGTSFVPVFEHLRHDKNVRAVVIFTDTWGDMPDWKPRFPVIWAVYEHAFKAEVKVPFGNIVVIPQEQN